MTNTQNIFMDLKTRKQAKSEGSKHYFTGIPCKNGHIALRRTGAGGCIECIKINESDWRKQNIDRVRNNHKKFKKTLRRRNPEKFLLYTTKNNAKRRGLEFNLTIEDITFPKVCPVLGIELTYRVSGKRQFDTPSLDRIDNSKGYVKGNVAVISWKANSLKRDGSLSDFESLVRYIKDSQRN